MDPLAPVEVRELNETWTADEVRFELRRTASTRWMWWGLAVVGALVGLPMSVVSLLMQVGAIPLVLGTMAVVSVGGLGLALILGVAGVETWSQRSMRVSLGARGLEVDGLRWGLEQIGDVWIEDGKLELQFQDGSRWTSAEVKPRDSRRLAALLRASLLSMEAVETHEVLEDQARRKLADLRRTGVSS